MAGLVDHPFKLIATPTSQLAEGEEPNVYHRLASEMACVHNVMVRGINSVYLQAPHVRPADAKSFLGYAYCFYDLMDVHHRGEEENIFPAIERMAGVPGLMAKNVEQHHEFHAGLEEYGAYLKACMDGKEEFDGKKLVDIIDRFGKGLTDHLRDEIPTLVGLEQYSKGREAEMAGLEKMFNDESTKHMQQFAVPGTLSWGFFNHDATYEGGLWSNWPPAPGVIKFAVRNLTQWIHSDWWKFAPMDKNSIPKAKLYATGD